MSGILDPRTRILDTLITSEGRRQIASGKLRVEWVSFSDVGTFYEADAASGSSDVTSRVYFEAASAPQDQITFEADDSGRLMPFKTMNDLGLLGGKLLQSTSGSTKYFAEVTSSATFDSLYSTILDSSMENIENLYVIGTKNELFDEDDFLLNVNTASFMLTDERPIGYYGQKTAYVDTITKLHEDIKLSHLPNFQFMPPINKVPEDKNPMDRTVQTQYYLGMYESQTAWQAPLAYDTIQAEVNKAEAMGYVQTITFDATSGPNNLLSQFFEIVPQEIRKLEVIDFGKCIVTKDGDYSNKHIFFVGKVIKTSDDAYAFIHLFTLIYE